MCLNPVNEEFERAYANVGLLASDVWSFSKNDTDFKKANLNLWVRCNEIAQRLAKSKNDNLTSNERVPQTVKDTIPSSKLASYNDYEYDEERERFYFSDDDYSFDEENSLNNEVPPEVWMLPVVEELFHRMTGCYSSRWNCASPKVQGRRKLAPASCVTTASPYDWLTQTTWPEKLVSRYPDLPKVLQRSTRSSFFKRELLDLPSYSREELKERLEQFPCPRYSVETNADLVLHTRIDSPSVRQIWSSHQVHYGGVGTCFGLNAEVPEFQPGTVRVQQYPSIYNTTYEAELFPYSNPTNHYFQRDLDADSSLASKIEEVHNIPVFLRPPESYYYSEPSRQKWRKTPRSGAVLSNLIPLTGTDNSTSTQTANAQNMLAFLDKWLSKIYNPRSTDFSSMSSISGTIDKIFQNVQQSYCSTQAVPCTTVEPQHATHRPLYSDVLMNEASVVSCSDSKYDELEREALEQYSGSDPALAHQVGEPEEKGSPWVAPSSWSHTRESKPVLNSANVTPPLLSPSHSPRSGVSTGPRQSCVLDILNSAATNKQLLWVKRKKKKAEKKKKISKKKTRASIEPLYRINENKIAIINKFIDIKLLFTKTFFKSDWPLVQLFVTGEVLQLFESCLKMLKECNCWFKNAIMSTNFKEDFKNNKKNLEFSQKIVEILHKIVNLLHQYIHNYSYLIMKIPCDQRLYANPAKVYSVRPLMNFFQDMPNFFTKSDTINVESRIPLEINKRNIQSLVKFIPRQYIWSSASGDKQEWMLENYDSSVKKKFVSFDERMNNNVPLLLNVTNNNIYLKVKEIPTAATRKMVKIIEEPSIWSSWQWRFVNGWKFKISPNQESLHWLNKLNIRLQENMAASANLLLVFDCAFKIISDVFFNKTGHEFEPVWNMQNCNLVSSKMIFMKVLLKQDDGPCFRIVRINKNACLPLLFSCVNTCCISLMMTTTLEDSSTVRGNVSEISIKSEEILDTNKAKQRFVEHFSKNQIDDGLSHDEDKNLEEIASTEIKLKIATEKTSICNLQ